MNKYHFISIGIYKNNFSCFAAPQQSMKDYFYKNADADEMIFVHEGSGV